MGNGIIKLIKLLLRYIGDSFYSSQPGKYFPTSATINLLYYKNYTGTTPNEDVLGLYSIIRKDKI
jgi:hypothetical protein